MKDILTLSITGGAIQVSINFANGDPLPLAGLYSDAEYIEMDGPHGSDPLVTTTNAAYVGSDEIRYPGCSEIADGLTGSNPVDALSGTAKILPATGETTTPDVFVAPGANVILAGSQTLSSLNISSGASVEVRDMSDQATVVDSLTISGPDPTGGNGGVLDLGNGDLIVRQGDLTGISYLLSAGYDGGLWDGQGPPSGPNPASIISSAAENDLTGISTLGYAQTGTDAGDLDMESFDSQSVSSGDVIVKFTTYGDANLDGTIDSGDYTSLENGMSSGLTGWTNGDFNYDQVIDQTDEATYNYYAAQTGAGPAIAHCKITAQATNLYAYGTWTYTNQTPGPTVLASTGEANQAIETRNVRAWYVRPMVRLYVTNDCAGNVVWSWGTVGYQIGYKDSSGPSTVETCEVYAVNAGSITLPSPYPGVKLPVPGISLPSLTIGGFPPNWQGYNAPGDPSVYGVSVPSGPPTGIPIGKSNANPTLPIPAIPAPPAGFTR